MNTMLFALAAVAAAFTAQSAFAQNVKVTALGSHDGEMCRNDRALIFEDPDGTRILYDAGRTVRGPDDARLGAKIDAVLLTHVHPDHIGEAYSNANAGPCGNPELSVKLMPDSNTVKIVVAKKAKLVVSLDMAPFFTKKITAGGGTADQVQFVLFGGTRKVGGVSVTLVSANHSNSLDPGYLEEAYAKALQANGLSAYLGHPAGYVLQFSNGLTVYLSGDTGITQEQEFIGKYYKAGLTVMNMGGLFTTGPKEAAYVVDELVKSKTVIVSHANEEATKGGQVTGNNVKAYQAASKAKVVVPLSGKTFEFDENATCKAGC